MYSEEKIGKLSKEEKRRYFKVIWWLRRHPIHAIDILFGIKLSPHQRITFKKMWGAKSIGLKLSRGMSKTFLDGVYLVLRAMLYKNATQIVLTRGFRGGKLVLREACQALLTNGLASQIPKYYGIRCLENFGRTTKTRSLRVINKDPDLWSINFAHGSNIQTGPLGQDVQKTSQLRGLRANTTLVLDESADIGDDLYTSVIRPFSRVGVDPVKGANIKNRQELTKIESGTIKYDWQRYTKELNYIESRMRNADHDYAVIEFNYEDCFYWVDNKAPKDYVADIRNHIKSGNIRFTYRMNIEDIFDELANGTTSWEDFLSENKNKIQVSEGTEFPSQLLEQITSFEVDPKYLDDTSMFGEDSVFYDPGQNDRSLRPLLYSDDKCILGVDPARESDDAAFVLVRLGQYRKCKAPFNDVISAKSFNKMHYNDLYAVIRQYLNNFPNIKKIIMDVGGGGYALRDLMWRPPDGLLPIYDPADPDTPEEVRSRGLPLLQLDQANNEKNTFRVNFVKGQMQGLKYLMAPFIYYTGDRELDDLYRNLKKLRQQYSYIVSAPSGNFKRYFVENNYKKDLFSASLLAMQGVYDELFVDNNVHVDDCYGYI